MHAAGQASLKLYDVRGKLVRVLVDGHLEGGEHRFVWDGNNAAGTPVSSGVYVTRLESAAGSVSRKVVLAK